MNPAKVLLADGYALFRQGMRAAIGRDRDLEIVGEAESCQEILAQARELQPDLILMDVHLEDDGSLTAIQALKRELPEVKIVLLTADQKAKSFFEAVKAGAEGFLSKDAQAQTLLESLHRVLGSEAVLSGHVASKLLREYARLAQVEAGIGAAQLTRREKQVLARICEGLSNKGIGECLQISENTVRSHVSRILRKLHIQTRFQAAAYARQMGIEGESEWL